MSTRTTARMTSGTTGGDDPATPPIPFQRNRPLEAGGIAETGCKSASRADQPARDADQSARADRSARDADQSAWDVAATVVDPEIPVLTIEDLGILRDVQVAGDAVDVTITPTYSGCPAMDAIRDDVERTLNDAGFAHVRVHLTLSPAWTTDWMSDAGKQKLQTYGIAAPTGRARVAGTSGPVSLTLAVKCPLCGSLNTRELTRFGSTSCKALYECRDCLEPFDYFKVL